MTDRIARLIKLLKSEEYKKRRYNKRLDMISGPQLSALMINALLLKDALESETPLIFEGERIGFNRSNCAHCRIIDDQGKEKIFWSTGNVVPDYEKLLNKGMDSLVEEIEDKLSDCDGDKRDFYQSTLVALKSALELADRYKAEAEKRGHKELFEALCTVPHGPATTLLEACIFLKFIIFTLRCNRNSHITLGRFDKYMRPFYYADLEKGQSRAELLETVEEFFVSINFDSDLYAGIQKGDNGQSLVLGGCGSFDDFSHLCMEASLELNLIDPKINLRVDKSTPDELYEFATLMTKQGLGFPQYCNDDVVIPGLISLGYAPEDAADYAVAACWEFIIPGKSMDVPNIATMNYPQVINRALFNHLAVCNSFEELMERVKAEIALECDALVEQFGGQREAESPYLSVFIEGCIEKGKDVSQQGAIYNNHGCHGAGIATAADSLAAVKQVVFDSKECSKEELLQALKSNFEGYGSLRNTLLGCPKMGNGDQRADGIAYELMDCFASHMNGRPNKFGGIYRAGTGSAHEYWYSAQKVGATADGRLACEPYGCSFSPSLEARLTGPLSCIRSFTGYDLKKVINGGPLTIEMHDTVFRNEAGIKKVAQLVKAFIHLGGHQLQLNCINRDTLLDALEHPENHKNLIVRVWGWSGYFNELDMPFKQHVIKRTEFKI